MAIQGDGHFVRLDLFPYLDEIREGRHIGTDINFKLLDKLFH